jgi:hypothetical protein
MNNPRIRNARKVPRADRALRRLNGTAVVTGQERGRNP